MPQGDRSVRGLPERSAHFELLTENAPTLTYLQDLDRGRLAYVNQRFVELLGYSRDELTAPGFDFLSLVAPDSVEKVRASREMHERGEDHLPFEFALLTRDGRRVEVMIDSWLTVFRGRRAVAGVMMDITAQLQLAAGLRRAVELAERERARAESVIAAIGDGLVIRDRDYRITYQNDVSRTAFGERVGERCYRVFEGHEGVCPGCPVERSFRDGGVHRHVSTVARAGRTRHLDVVSSPLRDGAGNVVAGLTLVRDITRQVESAEALRRAKEELERQNTELRTLDRMKDGLVRDVSHELKTPVAKQAMQLELLRAELGAACTGPVARTLEIMAEGVQRQQRVIRNLLDLARLESGRRSFRIAPVRVDEVIRRTLEEQRPTLEAAGFALALDVAPLTALADGEMLWHVLSNLVSNAVKFARREGPRTLDVRLRREADRAVVRVADNGIGLAPEELERAFDRFYRASASIEGSGVGLSICRSIMEGMGGTIALASPGRGRGAVATVTLPL